MLPMTAPSGSASKKETGRHGAFSKRETGLVSEQVGQMLRAMRKERKFSIRSLAERSGLSVNTLSLIENGKTSPSVNTLHRLAQSLDVPITAFFQGEPSAKKAIYQKAGERQQYVFSQGHVESLGADVPHTGSEPFIVRLEPDANSGAEPVVYAAREFIYCLEGQITYMVEDEAYLLSPGDSLILDTYTPHSWRNTASMAHSCALLVLCPEVRAENLADRFFIP